MPPIAQKDDNGIYQESHFMKFFLDTSSTVALANIQHCLQKSMYGYHTYL
jgi:hypothetical protein